MTLKLTAELDLAVREQGVPLRVVGADDRTTYVIVTGEQFDQLRAILDQEPPTLDEQRELLRRAGERAGWDDPQMDVYNRLDQNHAT